MNINVAFPYTDELINPRREINRSVVLLFALTFSILGVAEHASAQGVSGVRSTAGGVAPLFNLTGPGSLYVDNQGTQGYIYTPGQNFESYNFRNPTTGQAWTGALMTLGPQLSIGLIQGANQSTAQGLSPIVLPPPPRQTSPLPPIESGIFDEIP